MFNWRGLGRRDQEISCTKADRLAGAELHTIHLPRARGPEDSITIRLAYGDLHKRRTNMLINRMYASRGYVGSHRLPENPYSLTFTATSRDDVVGTLTLTIDSPIGLAADRTFNDQIERFRTAPGARLCELTRFAFDTSAPARPRLAALFHLIFIYGSMHHDCSDLFIEVNPRHRRFYEVMLGFDSVGEPRFNNTVGAPAQLMWLHVGNIRRQIDNYVGREPESRRSLYAHFFSASEEQRICDRLRFQLSGSHHSPARSSIFDFVAPAGSGLSSSLAAPELI